MRGHARRPFGKDLRAASRTENVPWPIASKKMGTLTFHTDARKRTPQTNWMNLRADSHILRSPDENTCDILISPLWDLKQRTQQSHVQTSDLQELWDNRELFEAANICGNLLCSNRKLLQGGWLGSNSNSWDATFHSTHSLNTLYSADTVLPLKIRSPWDRRECDSVSKHG